MESYEAGESHPYGVLPPGNMYFASQEHIMVRYRGLGHQLCKLTDETLGELLGYLSGADLLRVVRVSRALYCHGHNSDLWRDTTLREFNGKGIKFSNTWRDTYMYTRVQNKKDNGSCNAKVVLRNHTPIRIQGIFSNFLYRSWSCRTCDLETACPGFHTLSDIPVRLASELSVEQFVEQYEIPNKPVVIRGAMYDPNSVDACSQPKSVSCSPCPALSKWTNEYLIEKCGPNARLRATSAGAPLPAHFTAQEYFQYAADCKEEAPLYLFERNFSKIAPDLLQDYEIPKYFRGTTHNSDSNNKEGLGYNAPFAMNTETMSDAKLVYETDIFKLLGEQARPDYRWLVAGPARSGSLFHIDPNFTNAWNLCIRGRKKWIFYPPGVSPPGVECSADGADVVVPISTGEWLLTFWKYHLEARADPDPARRPLEVMLSPGEVMFVPHGYWHMVVNLDESIALTHNYISTANLADCLRFLRDKTDQISGVRDRSEVAIQPESIYPTLVSKLNTVLPQCEVDRYVQESLKPACSGLSDIERSRKLMQRAKTLKRSKKQNKRPFDTVSSSCGNGEKNRKKNASTEDQCSVGYVESKAQDLSVEPAPSKSFSFGFAFS